MAHLLSKILATGLAILLAVGALNLSELAPNSGGNIKILAHRGVHQTFHRQGLTNDTCTAERIDQPTHFFIENTLPSIAAAFKYGADRVEIDVRRTADGIFAVFHDNGLACRTDADGVISDYTMAQLRGLDVGYGYTADNGAHYPLRGRGVGLMPSLEDVLEAFPHRSFQINIKSNSALDAEIFATYLDEIGLSLGADTRLWSGPRFAERWREFNTGTKIATRREVKACAKNYLILGWSGHVPSACDSFGLAVPQNLGWLYWGWPRKTSGRFSKENIPIFLFGSLNGPTQSIDTLEQVQKIPSDYHGWIVTDRIDVVGPAVTRRRN